MKRILLLIFLAFFALASNEACAQIKKPSNYGTYFCGDCQIAGSSPNLGDIYIFLRSTRITSQWAPGDLITICDGAACVVMTWRGSTWTPVGGTFKDPHTGYKNDVGINSVSGDTYVVVAVWISPVGPLKNGTVTITVDTSSEAVGPNAGGGTGNAGNASVGEYEPGGDNLNGDPMATGAC